MPRLKCCYYWLGSCDLLFQRYIKECYIKANRELQIWEKKLTVGSNLLLHMKFSYSKTCVKRPLSKIPLIDFQNQLTLNAGQKYCSILHYFRSSLNYQLLLRSLFCLFLSDRFTQVLLHIYYSKKIRISYKPVCVFISGKLKLKKRNLFICSQDLEVWR